MAALGSPELPAPLQPASSILMPQPLGKATLSLLGLRMEELGALSELKLTLVVMATLKITLLWSDRDSRTPFLWRVHHCSKQFARRTLSTKSGLAACGQKTVRRQIHNKSGKPHTFPLQAVCLPVKIVIAFTTLNKPRKWHQLKSLDFRRNTGNLNDFCKHLSQSWWRKGVYSVFQTWMRLRVPIHLIRKS